MTRPDPATAWDPERLPDLSGRVYLITGANAGIGYFASEQLSRAGAHVVMSGRSPNRLAAARAAINRRVDGASVETLLLDTSNLGSVRAAAASMGARSRIDGVMLNAGIVHPPKVRTLTADGGRELVLATNVLGHFVLGAELLTSVARRRGRLVWLGSMATRLGSYDPVDLELEQGYTGWRAYAQSKVACQALGFEADRRLRERGVPVASVVVHPGYSVSGRTPGIHGVNTPSRLARFTDNLQSPIAQSKERGAWAPVRALVDPEIQGGEYWGPASIGRGAPRRQRPSKTSVDREVGARVWADCERLTGSAWPFEKVVRALRRGKA
ncbi:MAG TPA: SDR family NAD(P)-dependent oxidoreductase [Microbacterium sp.]|uniref:SDR family NAD(P)-dependent oxidoreductase n=1 Tax=Microbacterium sp. TaxID=51671 RepID=UPI002BED8C60|nr:SDR family NAD(P)-dependent oxidoreductase [Microbacterium sp.]HWI30970.1 SDR family NAD(P)-dependent oxidoreductase [Microbacterium sp.]